jgi:hypothetical protein
MRSKMSLTNEFRMAMALLEIPVSGCTCLNTTTEVRPGTIRDVIYAYPCRCS